jgi:hypothetical protein
MQSETNTPGIDLKAYAEKIGDVIKYIKRTDITEKAKNEAIRTVISKVVYHKLTQSLAIYFCM